MQAINQALDQMLKQKKAQCDCIFSSRISMPNGQVYCGDCSKLEIIQ